MRQYGKRKFSYGLHRHDECGICYPDQDKRLGRARARQEGRTICEDLSDVFIESSGVAQLVEQTVHTRCVGGSIPPSATMEEVS